MDKNVQEAYDRLVWDIKNIFDTKLINPYVADGEGGSKPKNRTAIEDIFHAIVNLPVEYLRAKGFPHPQRWVKIPLYIIAGAILLSIIF